MGMRDEQESLDLIASQGTGVHAEVIDVAAAATAEQFTSFVVNRPFVVKFQPLDGTAFVADTKAGAESGAARYFVAKNETITLKLGNVNEVWWKVATNGHDVQCLVETSTTLGN